MSPCNLDSHSVVTSKFSDIRFCSLSCGSIGSAKI